MPRGNPGQPRRKVQRVPDRTIALKPVETNEVLERTMEHAFTSMYLIYRGYDLKEGVAMSAIIDGQAFDLKFTKKEL